MKIEKNKQYRIKGESPYFKEKYGTSNPIIKIDGEDVELWHGVTWCEMALTGNWAARLFAERVVNENLATDSIVYGGHIDGLAELVNVEELEEIED